MTITVRDQSLKNKIDASNPNVLADQFRIIKLGDVIRAQVTFLRKKAPTASPYQLGTFEAFVLPDDAKASNVLFAYGRTGAIPGSELFCLPTAGAVPASGQIAVAPNGDLVVLAADGWTSVDVTYQPDKYDLVELILPVVPGTGVCSLPVNVNTPGAVTLLEAEALLGASTGKKQILIPQAAAPAASTSALNLDKTAVWFAVADAVTSARVKLSVSAAVDLDALLTADASIA